MKTGERLDYIDAVKGFAIVLVVMGHALARIFSDWRVIHGSSPSPSLLFLLIYSFHMPLFMFVSGFLFARKRIAGWRVYVQTVARRVVSLGLPFLFMGLLPMLWLGHPKFGSFWYLLTLLQGIVVLGLVFTVSDKVRKDGDPVFEALVVFILWILVRRFGGAVHSRLLLYLPEMVVRDLIDISHFRWVFLPFAAGAMVARWDCLDRIMTRPAFAVSLIGFPAAFLWGTATLPFAADACWFAIVGSVFLFKNVLTSGGIVRMLRLFGRRSLPIYLFHVLFTIMLNFKIGAIGDWFSAFVGTYGWPGALASVPMQFALSLAVSIPVCFLCVWIGWLVERVPVLNLLVLGRSGKR